MSQGRIFISYRRGTDGNAASRLYNQLAEVFGADRLFFDVDSIPPGIDFVEHLDGQVGKCEAFVAIIGPTWISAIEELHSETDFVRIEIESALQRKGIPVIPLLVDGAEMPTSDQLPDPLKPLVRRNGIPVMQRYFDTIIDAELIPTLRDVLQEPIEDEEEQEHGPVDPNNTVVEDLHEHEAPKLDQRGTVDTSGTRKRSGLTKVAWGAGVSLTVVLGVFFVLQVSSNLLGSPEPKVTTLVKETCGPDATADTSLRLTSMGSKIVEPALDVIRDSKSSRNCREKLVKALTFMMRDHKDQRVKIAAQMSEKDRAVLLKASTSKDRALRIHASEFLFDLGDPRVMDMAIQTWKNLADNNDEGFFQLAMIMTGAAPYIEKQSSEDVIEQLQALKGRGQKTDLQLSRAIKHLR
ncbi:MAG: toll/interleukin-1 receptor domain-containing protein [Pseudomonadota bacterium]